MYNLALHIEYLLQRHDCVTVPGFGAFINVKTSAKIDEVSLTVTPMLTEVRFNPSVTFDDGLLAHSYARKYSVPFEQGREILQKSLSSLRASLSVDREVTLGRLGILSLDDEDRLSFRPFSSSEKLMEEIGLVSVPVRKQAEPAISSSSEPEEISEVANIADIPVENTTKKERHFSENCYYIPVNKTFAKVAAILLVIVAVALSILLPNSTGNQPIDKASVMPLIDTVDKTHDIPSAESTSDKEDIPEKPAAASASQESLDMEEAKANKEADDQYYLIVATFMNAADAQEYISMQDGSGYKYEAVPSRKVCRVSVASSEHKEDLLSILRSPKFRALYPEAWIWHE